MQVCGECNTRPGTRISVEVQPDVVEIAQKPAHMTQSNYLIFFAFNLMVSPLTNMPFPLYGSGTLLFLILAAN